jgi:hypothetical protein
MKKAKHEISLTAGQVGEVLSPIIEVVLGTKPARVQYWIGRKKKLAAEVGKVLIGVNFSNAELISEWENFYRSLGINCDLSGVAIPDNPGDFDRVIIVAQGVTPQKLYNKCKELFPCWKWTDKNLSEIIISDRVPKNGSYAIRIRDRVEADEELKNLSANELKQQRIQGIILEERLIYELKYFKETGKHLDIDNWTLCSGSRYDDGDVPFVNWFDYYGKMCVSWCGAGVASGSLRSRETVS